MKHDDMRDVGELVGVTKRYPNGFLRVALGTGPQGFGNRLEPA